MLDGIQRRATSGLNEPDRSVTLLFGVTKHGGW